jgi:hypothetical protein
MPFSVIRDIRSQTLIKPEQMTNTISEDACPLLSFEAQFLAFGY